MCSIKKLTSTSRKFYKLKENTQFFFLCTLSSPTEHEVWVFFIALCTEAVKVVYSAVALFSSYISFLLSVYTRRHIIFIHLCAVILLRNNSKIMIVQ